MKNGIKNFIIAFLIVIAVYQTERLWFEGFSDHSLFYSFISSDTKTDANTKYILESILISTENNQFLKLSDGLYESNLKSVFDDAVSKALEKENFKEEISTDDLNFSAGKYIIYNYDCLIPADTLRGIFGIKNSKSGDFDRIIIIPNINAPQSLRVIPENSKQKKGWLFELKNDSVISETYNMAEKAASENLDPLYYISSSQNGFELFERNEFIPSWQGNNMKYPSIVISNPVEKDGGVLFMTIEKYINVFFENPAVKWNTIINDVYTYSDENTVVKYYTTGVLEYTSYKTGKSIVSADFNQNYSAAVNFMLGDTNIKNEYYLSSYEIQDLNTVFYFNYKINNLPIILTDEFKQKIDMSSMIEITVENGKVIKYKRLIYDFNTDEQRNASINTNFLEAIDKTISYSSSQEKITDMYMAYGIEAKNEPIRIMWFTETSGKIFRQYAEKRKE